MEGRGEEIERVILLICVVQSQPRYGQVSLLDRYKYIEYVTQLYPTTQHPGQERNILHIPESHNILFICLSISSQAPVKLFVNQLDSSSMVQLCLVLVPNQIHLTTVPVIDEKLLNYLFSFLRQEMFLAVISIEKLICKPIGLLLLYVRLCG